MIDFSYLSDGIFGSGSTVDLSALPYSTRSGVPCKAGPTGDGDSLLWAGLMYAVAHHIKDKKALELGILSCQSIDGRLWRSPDRVLKDNENSASRDMVLGFFLYLARSKDKLSFKQFDDYLASTKGKICEDATDTRGSMTLPMWWAMLNIGNSKAAPWYAKISKWMLPMYLGITSHFVPKGYQSHLVGVHCLLRLLMNPLSKPSYAAHTLKLRNEGNAFFAALAGHFDTAADDLVYATRVANTTPSTDPYSQWVWERDMETICFEDTMGWDMAFINLLLYQITTGHFKG